ncbi:MAG: hypothetical protein Ta2A_18220 [Treponemataceae bacterium]|nr:MAG: hypothetical protein Ta2A_18220 [Treponemataceae bacterium]
MSDLESSTGLFFPSAEYEGSYYQEALESGEYVHKSNVTSEGRWLFTCGPIFNAEGKAVALIETGYDRRTVEEQNRNMIVQTMLIVIAAAIAFLLIMIELILILEAYKKNKTEITQNAALSSRPKSDTRTIMAVVMKLATGALKKNEKPESADSKDTTDRKDAHAAFRPELIRAIIFFLFIANNFVTAILPMHAANLYEPLFRLSKKFVVIFPFMTDMLFAALALLLIPLIIGKFGIKRIGIFAGICMVSGNALYFLATGTAHLAGAYALTGFSWGALLSVINAIIGSQKAAQKRLEGAHTVAARFGASSLAGVKVSALIVAVLSAILLLNKNNISLSPWVTTEGLSFVVYASGNDERLAIISNSRKTVTVLTKADDGTEDGTENFVYKVDAKAHAEKGFSDAKFVELDEQNNLYVLDVNFGGAFNENVERVIKYSPNGAFLDVLYECRYTNVDFLTTKGKISGMAYFENMLYLIRFENDGFYLERSPSVSHAPAETVAFFEYPNALRDLVYVHINAQNKNLTVTTKAGGITQYSFDGELIYTCNPEPDVQSIPWTAVSDRNNNIIYADILSGEIVMLDKTSGESRILYTTPEDESPYYRINYAGGMLFAASYDETTDIAYTPAGIDNGGSPDFVKIHAYSYSASGRYIRIALFVLLVLDAGIALISFVLFITKLKIDDAVKKILLSAVCIAFGAAIAAVLIIDEMDKRYTEKSFSELENVSRLTAAGVDIDMLTSLTSPSQFDDAEYLELKDALKSLFSGLQFKGELLYQVIFIEKEGTVYMMSDLENSIGLFFPYIAYKDSYVQEVFESGQYVNTSSVTVEGRWLFTCGPILNAKGETVAFIETGYDMRMIEEQTRSMIVQTALIVAAAAMALLLFITEFILIREAFRKSKPEAAAHDASFRPKSDPRKLLMVVMHLAGAAIGKIDKTVSNEKKDVSPAFHPELLRALIFFLFVANNLATALLPMYAANLYQPLFGLPKEFIITLPFMTDTFSAALALLLVPIILEKFGIKKIGVLAGILTVTGHMLCFLANNTLYLAVAYALIGFSGGALLLVINTIIGAQKQLEDVNKGFAHFNASYLAGVNVGVVVGSICAQFFPYRLVYLFSTITATILLAILIFSVRSKMVNYLYNITYSRDKRKQGLIKFIFTPVVLATLFLILLPYMVSMSFISYFMPVFGTDNGLRESNIGQLILLSGLFAILFGASLCESVAKKFSLKSIIFVSLLLNIAAIYLFSLNTTIPMLIAVVVLLSFVNIFALTNIQTFYVTLYQGTRVSSMKALSVYSAVENIAMAIGPLVFSYILATDIVFGIRLFAAAVLVCFIFFFIVSRIKPTAKNVA